MKFLGMVKTNMAMVKAKLMTNVIMATGGTQTRNYGMAIVDGVLTVALGVGGGILVVVAVKDIVKSLMGDTKDWGGVVKGVVVGIIGGAFIAAAVGTLLGVFRNLGSDFGIIH